MDKVLAAIQKWQLPFLIGGTVTGIIMTYYYGFLFSIVVNSVASFISGIITKEVKINDTIVMTIVAMAVVVDVITEELIFMVFQ
jgi:hypothetical protein